MKTLTIFILLLSLYRNYIYGKPTAPKVLLISLDGFRYDYLSKYNAPNLNDISKYGVSTPEGMIPSFPSVTFPNHQTLVTGLYPESHGIIYNKMYDPTFNESFAYGSESKWWDAAEPVWITAKKSRLKTGVIFWPGATVLYNGITADYVQGFEDKQNFSTRVDLAIDWLVKKDLNLVVLYFEQPDSEGHEYGPDSPEVAKMVTYVDSVVGDLFSKLKQAGVYDNMNIIVASDHGMATVNFTKENVFMLSDYLNITDYVNIQPGTPQWGAVGSVLPTKGNEEAVFNALNGKHPHVKVYFKKDIPERFHYQHNRRIMPIIAFADEHYYISLNDGIFKYRGNKTTGGVHGYDVQHKSMRAIFLATGPSFKKKVTLNSFNNTNVYSLLCHLLNITPRPSNGSLTTFESILENYSNMLKPSLLLCILSSLIINKM